MNWSRVLAEAGIPDSPGRAEVVRQTVEQRQRAVLERDARDSVERAAHEARLAAQGDKRKAVRSKVRVGA
jgi:hypothetical protein